MEIKSRKKKKLLKIALMSMALFFVSHKAYTWSTGPWNYGGTNGGYYTNGGYSPCPANTSCVIPNGLSFINPYGFTPTSLQYNQETALVPYTTTNFNTFTQSVTDSNGNLLASTYFGINSNSTNSWNFYMHNPYSSFLSSTLSISANGGAWSIRQQSGGLYLGDYAGSLVMQGNPTVLTNWYSGTPIYQIEANPFSVSSNSIPTQTGIGITIATNAGLGISTLTQNNALLNTGPIYPRNPANVGQTLSQPTIVTVYDNNTAGLSYTGWVSKGSGNLVAGVLTVNLGLSYDNTLTYACTASYDGVPATITGILGINRVSGSQFSVTSYSSLAAVNTTDVNKVQWVCGGY